MIDTAPDDKLTPRQYKALAALCTTPTTRKAAEVAGVPESTLRVWLKKPAFNAEYEAMLRDITEQTKALIQKGSIAAASTLCQLSTNGKTEAIRLAASGKVVDYTLKIEEIRDLRNELEALKALIRERLGDADL